MKRKAFSLVEVILVLFLLTLSVSFLVTFAFNYLRILVSIRERFVALNLAQEGLELAIALRNKQIETGGSPWYGSISVPGSYCLSFNTSTRKISTTTPVDSSKGCPIKINGLPVYFRLIRYEQIGNIPTATSVKIISKVTFGKDDFVQLNTLLTRWHPTQ